jgi:monolysocardiolipin acyltransferase
MMLEKMNEGEWAHVFPEGQVNLSQEWMRLKWGIGRLVSECKIPPLVLPFWHEGLTDVLPNSTPYIPQVRQKVTVVFGQVIDTR